MNNVRNVLENFVRDESGQDLIEYALIAALVGLTSVATLQGVATSISGLFSKITAGLDAA